MKISFLVFNNASVLFISIIIWPFRYLYTYVYIFVYLYVLYMFICTHVYKCFSYTAFENSSYQLCFKELIISLENIG